MSGTTENREESIEEMRQILGAIIDEQTARQKEITLRQDMAIAAIADTILKLTNNEHRSFPYDAKWEPSNVKRAIKLDFPRFIGEGPEGWLYQTDEYFAFHGIEEESKVQIAGMHMTGKALSWIRGMRRIKLITTWAKFVEDLREQFGAAEYENKLEELTSL